MDPCGCGSLTSISFPSFRSGPVRFSVSNLPPPFRSLSDPFSLVCVISYTPHSLVSSILCFTKVLRPSGVPIQNFMLDRLFPFSHKTIPVFVVSFLSFPHTSPGLSHLTYVIDSPRPPYQVHPGDLESLRVRVRVLNPKIRHPVTRVGVNVGTVI